MTDERKPLGNKKGRGFISKGARFTKSEKNADDDKEELEKNPE